ncbi:hypothetical protein K438DRAFT_1930098, partial [Mycena galopus ATCC 62051]
MPSPLPRAMSESTLFNILGVLCAQFVHYLSVNGRDSWSMKLFVAGLALLTTLKSMHILAVNWLQDTALLDSLEALSNLWWSSWVSELTIILEAIITFYVQMFFCHRLWSLSHNKFIVGTAIALFLMSLAAAGAATHFFLNTRLAAVWFAIHLGFAMGGDLLQTGSIIFYLLRHSKNALARSPTQSMLKSLLRVTIQ